VRTLSGDLGRVLTDRRHGPAIIGLSVLTQLIPVGALFLIAAGCGLQLPTTSFLVLGPSTMLAAALPLSLAGWGVREAALVVLLTEYGVVRSDAFAVSVLFGMLLIVAALPGAVAWGGIASNRTPAPHAQPITASAPPR
jgi:glycosyltransferase 2 family protein